MSAGSESTFRHQHQTLLGLGALVAQAMSTAKGDTDIRALRLHVARFKGALLVHQRMENDALYPRLIAHPDPAIAEAARALYADLGGIYDQFVDLELRFGSLDAIASALPEYCASLRRILKRLFLRMQREDEELYALAKRADVSCVSEFPPADVPDVSASEERERWAARLNE
jgi:hypothetical protein